MDEVVPYFVALSTLASSKLDHLRFVGLLPPRKPTTTTDASSFPDVRGDDEVSSSNDEDDTHAIRLLRRAHVTYLHGALSIPLSRGYVSLDASHPWMVYWCLHSLDILGYFHDNDDDDNNDRSNDNRSNDNYESDDESDDKSGAKKTMSMQNNNNSSSMLLEEKHNLLLRVVSTLQYCWTDVDISLDNSSIKSDIRIQQLLLQQTKTKTKTTMASSNNDGNHDDGSSIQEHADDDDDNNNNNNEDSTTVIVQGGGFGGGPAQMPHCAATYAAVLALSIVAGLGGTVILSSASAAAAVGDRVGKGGYSSSNNNDNDDNNHYMPYSIAGRKAQQLLTNIRLKLYAFFLSLRVTTTTTTTAAAAAAVVNDTTTTAFRMQHDGEIDVRATYCILAPCYLLQLIDINNESSSSNNNNNNNDTFTTNAATPPTTNNPLQCISITRHIASCQTYEGGFGAETYNEAHGGYAFCAIASLRILNKLDVINGKTFLYWACSKQLSYEGGFAGRTNKLVDGCYSFWQGGAIVIMNNYLQQQQRQSDDREEEGADSGKEDYGSDNDDKRDKDEEENGPTTTLFDEYMLQRYILLCAQDVNGGLRDKPSKSRDFYHSCYNLSGLSVSQQHNHITHVVVAKKKTEEKDQQPQTSLVEGSVTNNNCDDNGKGEVMGGDGATKMTTRTSTRQEQSLNRNIFGDVRVNIVGKTDPVINIRVEYVQYMLSQQYSK